MGFIKSLSGKDWVSSCSRTWRLYSLDIEGFPLWVWWAEHSEAPRTPLHQAAEFKLVHCCSYLSFSVAQFSRVVGGKGWCLIPPDLSGWCLLPDQILYVENSTEGPTGCRGSQGSICSVSCMETTHWEVVRTLLNFLSLTVFIKILLMNVFFSPA